MTEHEYENEYVLTDSGRTLARELFGSNDPEPTSPTDDTSTPATQSAGAAETGGEVTVSLIIEAAGIGDKHPAPCGHPEYLCTCWLEDPESDSPTPTVADSGGVWTHTRSDYGFCVDPMEWNWLFAGTDRKPNAHGRPARRHSLHNKAQNKAAKRRKLSSSVNMEKNTPEARNWRNKRNLANAVAMPIPAITGAELLQQAALTVVPKARKQMTRVLEGRAA